MPSYVYYEMDQRASTSQVDHQLDHLNSPVLRPVMMVLSTVSSV